jgi:predicted RND superfamily exporter protein
MAEAKGSTFGWLFSHRFLLDKLERPERGAVTNRFFTQDRRRALFVLRMREAAERHDRLATIEEIRAIARARGFEVEQVAGLYALQGQVSQLLTSSLVTGVGQLLASFAVVAALVSRSLRATAALVFSLALVPAILLGALGLAGMPLDLISAPAVNIALGMAIDDMIHISAAARRLRQKGASAWEAWSTARADSARALVGTASVVGAGFAILLLSSFPPTRRFGLAMVGGALLDVLTGLVVLPYLVGARPLRKLRSPSLDRDARHVGLTRG